VGMGNVEVGGGCWGSSDVMGFGLEAWVGGEKGGGVRGRWGSLICCVCWNKKAAWSCCWGCYSLGFVSVWFSGVELGCCDLEMGCVE